MRCSRMLSVLLLSLLAGPCSAATRGQAAPAGQPALAGKPAVSEKEMQSAAGQEAIPEPLTVEEAVRIGLARNPQTAAGLAGAASAKASYQSLKSFPSVQLGVTHVQGTSSAPTLNGETSDTFMDLGETLDTSRQRHFQAAGAKAQWNVTRGQYEESTLTLAQQIRDAYWSLVAARAQTKIAEENLGDVQRVYQLTRVQSTAGASPALDVTRSSIDVATAEQNAVTARGAEQAARSALNLLLARPPDAPVRPADDLAETSRVPQLLASLPGLPVLTRDALATRPALKSARAQVRAADYAWKEAKAATRPDLSVDYERSLNQPIDSVVMGISFPLLDFGSERYAIKAAQEARQQARAQQQQTEQQVVQQVAQAYADFTQARKLVASYQTDILAPSVKLLDAAQFGYQQGASGILTVIDAETTLRNARTGFITDVLALYRAADEIGAATGAWPAPPAGPTRAGSRLQSSLERSGNR